MVEIYEFLSSPTGKYMFGVAVILFAILLIAFFIWKVFFDDFF